jgi:predicted hotdog family 3-hydroxylacyl-ACP dehydratase
MLTVREDNIFAVNGEFREPGLLENIAQTAAARAGYIAQQENKPSPIGFIGAVKNFEVFYLPKINDIIETEITIMHQIFDATIITGRVWCKELLLAQCEMKIFIRQINQPST